MIIKKIVKLPYVYNNENEKKNIELIERNTTITLSQHHNNTHTSMGEPPGAWHVGKEICIIRYTAARGKPRRG